MPPGPDNPWANAFVSVATPARDRTPGPARRRPVDQPHWKIVNPESPNRLGLPVAYKLAPGVDTHAPRRPRVERGDSAPASPPSNLWVTPYAPEERRAAGDYPNQHIGGDGPAAVERRGPVRSSTTDIVLWYTFGVTHIPRPEDWPVMPVEYAGFQLVPVGFFDRNPAIDVPPPPVACHPE